MQRRPYTECVVNECSGTRSQTEITPFAPVMMLCLRWFSCCCCRRRRCRRLSKPLRIIHTIQHRQKTATIETLTHLPIFLFLLMLLIC